MKRVIVAGAAGYLGSCITKRLCKDNYDVLCILSNREYLSSLAPVMEEIQIVLETDEGFCDTIKEFNADIIINTICRYQTKDTTISEIVESNLIFPLQILELTANESATWINTATALSKDVDFYSLSKWQFCEWGKEIADKYKMNFYNVVLEMFFGPGEDIHRFTSYVIDGLQSKSELHLTKGFQKRDLIYIDDLVEAYIMLCKFKEKGYWDIPVGLGCSPSIREIVMFLKEEVGSNTKLIFGAIPERDHEPQVSVADTTILQSLGWKPKYSWKEGLKKMLTVQQTSQGVNTDCEHEGE